MKTHFILTILTSILSLTANASSATNTATLTTVPQTSHRTLYANNDLADSVKWECDLDDQGRVVTQAGYVLNPQSGEWIPRVAYSVFYGQDETIVTTAKWDSTRGSFRAEPTQQKYAAGYLPDCVKIK